ncbi:valacyclovir hydrolase-like [Oppia nitens]|uniref:valacyclovir hydrolase-like n=1 Tax=Oppia nitens TaxID=1686743 RepID=UPI0023DC21E6|nr:valacyclovir hydrolase-like [Oppia nitens]
MPETETGRVEIDDLSLYYERTGTGEHVVLLLPGVLGTVQIEFSQQWEAFDLTKFTLIAWDPPGFGLSRPPERNYKDAYIRDGDLILKFMKHFGYEKYSIMGFSDSGRTSMIFAARYPQVMRKMVIWGTCAFIGEKEKKTLSLCKEVSGWSNERKNIFEPIYKEDLQMVWGRWVDENNRLKDFATQYLKDIKCPTFILHGENDIVTPMEPHALYLKKNISGARLVIFPKAAHTCHQEKAADFNRLVQDFLLK